MHELTGRAPARIDFGGGWTDVPPYSDERGGCVCSAAIDLHAVVTLGPAAGSDAGPEHEDAGMAMAALKRRGATGVRLSIESEYPVGAGLGGSSAASVASLGTLRAWQGRPIDPAGLAEESRLLEVEDLHIAGGRQDHYAAAFGGVLGLRFEGATRVEPVQLAAPDLDRLASQCVLVYTGQSRISADTITAVIDAYRSRERRVLVALDRMRELASGMITSIRAADFESLGRLVGEHWIHQRSLHPAIPTPRIDAMLDAAARAGALGGKAMGASGGGCVLAIAPLEHVDRVRDAMSALGEPLRVRIAHGGFHVEPADAAGGAVRRPWTSVA
jgi:D-glycero-alpha-D-manno-heptose-7-phosphate kinase